MNFKSNVRSMVLDWFKPPDLSTLPKYDVIIASDVVCII